MGPFEQQVELLHEASASDIPDDEFPTTQETNAVAERHLNEVPQILKPVYKWLHGLEKKRDDFVHSDRINRQQAKRIWDYLIDELTTPGGGQKPEKRVGTGYARKLRHGYGFKSPAGLFTIQAPKYKSRPWEVTYSSQADIVWDAR